MRWKPRSTSTPLLFSVRIATPFTFEASDATLAWLFWGGPAALGDVASFGTSLSRVLPPPQTRAVRGSC